MYENTFGLDYFADNQELTEQEGNRTLLINTPQTSIIHSHYTIFFFLISVYCYLY